MDFQLGYNRTIFKNYLKTKLLGDKFQEIYEELTPVRKTAFFVDKGVYKIGEIHGLEKEFSILEIKQRGQKDPRITLTKDTFKLMQDYGIRNALIVFYVDGNSPRRFSLLTTNFTEDFKKELSSPKRYSYILGPGEKTKTPEQYLTKQISDYQDLIDRFDVEVVRKDFFEKYLELYIRLYKEIKIDTKFSDLLLSQSVDLVSFTKNLLGKIIFLYFIQQKGWLGLGQKEKEYGKGNRDFMRVMRDNFNKDESMSTEKTGFFYNDYLERLFFAGLNVDRSDQYDRFPSLKMKVPYLNGGLFKEEYKGRESNVAEISNDMFSNVDTKGDEADGILDIFDRYNFTVDEDSLYDSDIAVDPEMLGRIFEKMISISSENIDEVVALYDNKGKKKLDFGKELNKKLGAFYTPREIVHYMTKESLIAYLVNNIKGDKEQNEKLIRDLFDLKEQFLLSKEDLSKTNFSSDIFDKLGGIIEQIDDALKKVKILDPAVGSGAFPMGLLHEVSSIRYYIYGIFYKTFGVNIDEYKNENGKISLYKIKREIILNNIYGVDIDPGAIDIARLRFWLSLIVDEEQPEPLPNFEFKFVCANTLIPLEEETKEKDLFAQGDEPKLETLKKYKKEYYNASGNKEKQQLKERIRDYTKVDTTLFSEPTPRAKQMAEFGANFDNSKHSHSFFDPSLMMSEWRGFDIVIGNPPYIKEYDNRNAFSGIKGREYYMGKMDIRYYFACYGLDLLKDGGIESFIAQNNWITSHGAKIMRNKILEDAKIKEFIDFGDYKVFQNVGIQTMIYILEKNRDNKKYQTKYSRLNNKDYKNINNFLYDQQNTKDYEKHLSKIEKLSYLDKTLDFVDAEKDSILEKISNEGTLKLTEKEVAQGIVYPQDYLNDKNNVILGGYYKVGDGIFVLSDAEKESLNLTEQENKIVKPSFNTEQFGRYIADNKNKEWVIYTDSSFKDISKIDNYPNIKNHLDKFKKVITSDNKPYGLHRSRDERFFIGEKIIATRKCAKPSFSYVDFDSYVSATFYVIKTDRINQKYLIGLLNSSLIEFWLKNKGKMQGSNYQLDKEPLINIPIKESKTEIYDRIIQKVDQILSMTNQPGYDPKHPPQEQLDLEKEIDQMVYELYGLSDEEVKVVEESLG